MKIVMHEADRFGLVAFADANDLIMEIHERVFAGLGARWTEDERYYAHFKDCEIRERGCLLGALGNGATPEAAMRDYARRISGKLLVVDAWLNSRREITVPLLTNE